MFTSFFNATNYFDRPFLERDGYAVKEKDGKLTMQINVLGLGKDDIEIKIIPSRTPNNQILSIEESEKTSCLAHLRSTNVLLFISKWTNMLHHWKMGFSIWKLALLNP